MKLKTKHIGLGATGLLLLIIFSTHLFSNLWLLLIGNGYIIPKESSIFSFKSTIMNSGSGDYWLYGEDNTNYYTTLLNKEAGYSAKYFLISKEKATKLSGFQKLHYSTWFEVNVECGDLLKKYAKNLNN